MFLSIQGATYARRETIRTEGENDGICQDTNHDTAVRNHRRAYTNQVSAHGARRRPADENPLDAAPGKADKRSAKSLRIRSTSVSDVADARGVGKPFCTTT